MKTKISGITIECMRGDIASQPDMEAIVNAANAQLRIGGGVAGAIHRAAGPGLEEECRPMAPIKPGEAVISGGHNLPNKYVIHCLGPVYGKDKPEDKLLADCYRNALKLADENNIRSIAFPAISTGAFGYPIREAAEVTLDTIKEVAPALKNVKTIRFVLFSKGDYEIYKEMIESIGHGAQK
ncbi:macro domain-containing protein [Anaerophaga thermohalophila]|uniref:macro domain-containing protein n=1 Tax=Anaerophaga thermohalophila TaxID=177400 RepID=UPI000317EAED|nr:macro domain-containing protein [Anaerophaga thermohalophila]